MSYLAFVAGTPYSWIAACGLLTGVALGGVTRVLRPLGATTDGFERARRRSARAGQLTRVLLYLALAVACVPAAVFIPGAERILDPMLPRFFIGAMIGGFLIERFPRAFGIPVVFLAVLATVAGFGVISLYRPVYGRTVIAEMRALSVREERSRIELLSAEDPDLPLVVVSLSGAAAAPAVSTLRLGSGWFVFGRNLGYRIVGLDAYAVEDGGEVVDRFRIDDPQGWEGVALRVLEAVSGRVPGVDLAEVTAAPRAMRVLERYAVVLDERTGELEMR